MKAILFTTLDDLSMLAEQCRNLDMTAREVFRARADDFDFYVSLKGTRLELGLGDASVEQGKVIVLGKARTFLPKISVSSEVDGVAMSYSGTLFGSQYPLHITIWPHIKDKIRLELPSSTWPRSVDLAYEVAISFDV